jgi:hypothetical protein
LLGFGVWWGEERGGERGLKGGGAGALYKPVERAPCVFNPLKVPAKLQAALPFKTKPKLVSCGWGDGMGMVCL